MDFAVFLLMVGCRIVFHVDFSLMDFAVFLLMVGCRIVFH